MKKNKNPIKKNVFWMGVVSYFTDISSEMLMPILPIFFQDVLGINKAFIGLIEGLAESFSSFLKIVSGYLSDKFKKRKMFIILGYAIPAFIKPLYIFAGSWVHVLILRFIERSGKGFRDPPRDALIAASSDKKNLGEVFGFQRMMDTFGAVTGVLLLSIILYFLPNTLRALFIIAFIPGLISFVIATTKVKEDKRTTKDGTKISMNDVKNLPFSYKIFLIPTFIFAIGNMSYAFFILRAENLGLPVYLIPLVYLLYTIIYAVFALPVGKLSDRIGSIPTLIIGNVFFLAACVLFIMQIPVYLVWAVFALYGLFFAFNVGVSKAYITNVVPEKMHGTAIGVQNFIMGICAFPASFVAGYLWETVSVEVAFGYSAVLTAISMLVYIFMLLSPKVAAR
ncbi:MFS transporter [bacterium]|nr:MFS transporter [bacterium]